MNRHVVKNNNFKDYRISILFDNQILAKIKNSKDYLESYYKRLVFLLDKISYEMLNALILELINKKCVQKRL